MQFGFVFVGGQRLKNNVLRIHFKKHSLCSQSIRNSVNQKSVNNYFELLLVHCRHIGFKIPLILILGLGVLILLVVVCHTTNYHQSTNRNQIIIESNPIREQTFRLRKYLVVNVKDAHFLCDFWVVILISQNSSAKQVSGKYAIKSQ